MAVCSSSSPVLNNSSTTLSLAFNFRSFPEHLRLLAAASTNSFCGDIPTRQRWFRGNTQTLKKKKKRGTRLGTYNHQIEEEENMFRDRKERVKERSGRLEVKSGHFERNFSKGTSSKAQVAKPWC